MTRMTGPDCVVMCNLINTYIHTYIHREDQCEWHRMTRMTGPDCVVMCNLINTCIHTYIHTYICIASDQRFSSEVFVISIIDPPSGGSMRVA